MRKSVCNCLLVAVLSLIDLGCRFSEHSEKIAEVDGTPITRAEVDRSAGKALANLRQQLYQMEQQKLDEYIGATLLTKEAKNRNLSVSTLLEQEIDSRVSAVSEEEIAAFYDTNKGRIGVGLEKVHDQIRDYLREQKIAERKTEYFKRLRANVKITTYLRPPPIHRADLSIYGAPFKGMERAPITIVKFEDFECPFCKSVQPTLTELVKRYHGKVRLVHKDLPLAAIHPQAQLAAEAARCAGEQGKFWEYHDALYRNSPKLAAVDLHTYAKGAGLNTASFDQCLASGRNKVGVQKDYAEAAQLGLTGTPAFFINGREISGAQPLGAFAAIIDEELDLQGKSR
jgi:protein-disulfide isomerase